MRDEEYQELANDTYNRINVATEFGYATFSVRLLAEEIKKRDDTAMLARMYSAYQRLLQKAQEGMELFGHI